MDVINSFDTGRPLTGLGAEPRNRFGMSTKSEKPSFEKTLNEVSASENKPKETARGNDEAVKQSRAPEQSKTDPVYKNPIRVPGKDIASPQQAKAIEAKDELNTADTEPLVADEVAAETDTVDSLNRRAVLQNFLKRMKNELGVGPTDIMNAFAALSPQDLQMPPQVNINKIVDALPVNEMQKPMARQIISEMIIQTEGGNLADYMKTSGRQLSIAVMSQKEQSSRTLNNSIDDLNSKFFVDPRQVANKNAAVAQVTAPVESKPEANKDSSSNWIISGGAGASAGEAAPLANSLAPAPSAVAPQMAATAATPLQATNVAPASTTAETAVEDTLTQLNKLMQSLDSNATAVEETIAPKSMPVKPEASIIKSADTAGSSLTESLWTPAATVSESQLSSNANQDEDKGQEQAPTMDGRDTVRFDQAMAQDARAVDAKKESALPNMFMDVQPNEADHAANVRDMVTHAETLIKKGGGEMKLTLNPEGLGKMSMKVSVQDGAVNVEMIADNSSAKKVIEKSLGDLKASLAAHQLNVDNIKVDTMTDISKHMQQRYDEANKQFAQNFMDQFRQNNQEWRQGFYDIQGARVYKSQTRDRSDNDGLKASEAARQRAQSRRLDLVA